MQIVIDIPDEVKEAFDSANIADVDCYVNDYDLLLGKAIKNGTPLPKGHGDLIDVNRKITVTVYDEQYEEWGEETLTVREALNRWSDEVLTVKDVVILADEAESEDKE